MHKKGWFVILLLTCFNNCIANGGRVPETLRSFHLWYPAPTCTKAQLTSRACGIVANTQIHVPTLQPSVHKARLVLFAVNSVNKIEFNYKI